MKKLKLFYVLLTSVAVWAFTYQQKPVLYLIGDSTVRNNDQVQWGWGTMIKDLFDQNKISISNNAMAGRSTRTFIKEGRWHKVDSLLRPGDFVMMQFGHNEGSVPDTTKAGYRGVLKGTGDETKELTWPDGTPETVHTYGWYIRKFIRETKAKGATPIVLSMIPRNEFRDGKVLRADNDYGKWAKEVAQQEGAFYIDLNAIIADRYDQQGEDKVTQTYFTKIDHTHTSLAGAELNAAAVAQGISQLKHCRLSRYLVENSSK